MSSRHRLVICLVVLAGFSASASEALAQGQFRNEVSDRPLLSEVAKRVAWDPTTYAPTILVYTTRQLDWNTSQPLFRMGYFETHPGYTRSGLSPDVPVSYAEGNRRIRRQTTILFGRSLANNAICAGIERALIARAPRHRKLIRTLGWIERTAFASYWSYTLSIRHIEQWQRNQAMARQVGAT
jgi:hypothetical protein